MSFTYKVFEFAGRIGRLGYLVYTILNCLAAAVIIVPGLLLARPGLTLLPGILLIVAAAFSVLWVNLALTAKRLHDTGHSGAHTVWIAVVGVVAAVSAFSTPLLAIGLAAVLLLVFLWLVCTPGEAGRNLFGPDPNTALPRDSAVN